MTTEVVHHVPDLPDDPRLVDVLRRGAYMVAAAGYFVFPVRPWHKTPAVEDWEHAATRDAIKIGRWWRARPYNLLTGLTRDPPSQMATAEPIARRTSASNVRGGHVEGRHEHHLRDIGAVVLPDWGRVVADDDVGWRVVDPAASPCARCAICRASCWRRCDRHRISRCRRPARCGCPTGRESGRSPGRGVRDLEAYMQRVVTEESRDVADAPQGQSHTVLVRAALKLGNYVGGGALSEQDARRPALLAAGTAHFGRWRCDCTEAEVLRTINFGLSNGRLRPLHPDDRFRPPT